MTLPSTNTAVFARNQKPEGQTNGFSILLIQFENQEELTQIKQLLCTTGQGLPEPYNHDYQWFGGNDYDLVATFSTTPTSVGFFNITESVCDLEPVKCSLGDERYVGFYYAKDLLVNPSRIEV